MRFIALCPVACEDACVRELESLSCSSFERGLGFVSFSSDDIWRVLRFAQTVSHVLLEAGRDGALSDDAARTFSAEPSFRVSALTGSRDEERRVGAVLFESFGVPVDLKDPAVEVGLVEDRLGFVLSGFDYSLREYKVYKTPRSLNPCVAASILWGLDVEPGVLCDPLSHDGVLPIEFALRSFGISPRRFQERTFASRFASRFTDSKWVREQSDAQILALEQNANYLRRAEHNARLAGVADMITFSRYDLEWIDMRVGEREVDSCVLELPHRSSKLDGSSYDRLIAEVGVAARHMLAGDGRLIVVTNDPLVSFDGFTLSSRMVVPRGELALYALAFGRVR